MGLRSFVKDLVTGGPAATGPLATGPSQHATPPNPVEQPLDSNDGFVRAAYWVLLGREPDEAGLGSLGRLLELGQPRERLLLQFLTSTEFRLRRERLIAPPEDEAALERALTTLGADRAFVETCYACLLGRPADEEGTAVYVDHLARGAPRLSIVRALLASQEFGERHALLCPRGGTVPVDEQLCELANPAKWDNPGWMAVLRELRLPADQKVAMHRKAYEFTQTVWGLRRLGRLEDTTRILSVGAGHEALVFWLANHAGSVVATDLYSGEWGTSSLAAEGDIRVVTHPEEFAPFPYRRERLRFLQMNGCQLAFRNGTFDVAYSLSSIEHFGGYAGARQALEEMARVLVPGGLLVMATEWVLSGVSHPEVFQPDEVRQMIDLPGMSLVEPIDERVWERYRPTPIDLRRNPYETPHMVVEDNGTVFTSVIVFLRKA